MRVMTSHWSRSVGFCLSIFTWCCFNATVFIKQQAAYLDVGVEKWLRSVTTPSSAALIPVFMSGAVAHLPAHAAEVWNADLETPDHSGIMLTDPPSRFLQSLLSHKERCHVAKFKSMWSAFLFAFLGMPEGSALDAKLHKPLRAHTDPSTTCKTGPSWHTFSVHVACLYQRTVQTSSSRWTASYCSVPCGIITSRLSPCHDAKQARLIHAHYAARDFKSKH